jgi:uncharacterized membrane protein YgcG
MGISTSFRIDHTQTSPTFNKVISESQSNFDEMPTWVKVVAVAVAAFVIFKALVLLVGVVKFSAAVLVAPFVGLVAIIGACCKSNSDGREHDKVGGGHSRSSSDSSFTQTNGGGSAGGPAARGTWNAPRPIGIGHGDPFTTPPRRGGSGQFPAPYTGSSFGGPHIDAKHQRTDGKY